MHIYDAASTGHVTDSVLLFLPSRVRCYCHAAEHSLVELRADIVTLDRKLERQHKMVPGHHVRHTHTLCTCHTCWDGRATPGDPRPPPAWLSLSTAARNESRQSTS